MTTMKVMTIVKIVSLRTCALRIDVEHFEWREPVALKKR